MRRSRGFYASDEAITRRTTNPRLRYEDLVAMFAMVAEREERKARRPGATLVPETPLLFDTTEATRIAHIAGTLRMDGLDELAADALMDAIAVMASQLKFVLDHADERAQRRAGDEWGPA